jgi:hypothetical protein
MTAARIAAFFLVLGVLRAELLVDFPTDNHALLEGRPQDFFMYVNRDFEGEKSKPWEGGQFGFVRGPVRNGDRILCIQFHEGIDIRPVHRDAQAIPPTRCGAAAAPLSTSVAKPEPRTTEVRRVEHRWDGCPFYTIYAHLASIPSNRASPCARVNLSASWVSQAPESIGSVLTSTSRSA